MNTDSFHLHFIDREHVRRTGGHLCFFFKHRLQRPGLICWRFTQRGRRLTEEHVSEVLSFLASRKFDKRTEPKKTVDWAKCIILGSKFGCTMHAPNNLLQFLISVKGTESCWLGHPKINENVLQSTPTLMYTFTEINRQTDHGIQKEIQMPLILSINIAPSVTTYQWDTPTVFYII